MEPQAAFIPRTGQPAVLTRLVGEMDGTTGWGLILPVLKVTLLIAVPVLGLEGLAILLRAGPPRQTDDIPFGLLLLGFFLAPVLQAVVLRFSLHWLGKVLPEPASLNLACSVLLGLLYGQNDLQILAMMWTCYVTGAVFLRLQPRSLHRAYGVVIILHALVSLLAYGRYLLR